MSIGQPSVFLSLSLSPTSQIVVEGPSIPWVGSSAKELKRKHTKAPGAVLSLARLCFHPSLQQTILKHARIQSDEFGGRHRVTSRLCALLSIPLFVRDSASSTTIASPIVWLAQPLRRPIVNCNHLKRKITLNFGCFV